MSKKSDRQDRFTVSTYLLSIKSCSITVQHPMSEYFPTREYYGISKIMSQTSL